MPDEKYKQTDLMVGLRLGLILAALSVAAFVAGMYGLVGY